MLAGLVVGDMAKFTRRITAREAVPEVFPDCAVFKAMPPVFATAYMIGLIEWACVEHLAPHVLPGHGSVGTHVDVSHSAPSVPGSRVTVESRVETIEGPSVWFAVLARDEAGVIGEGRHRRALVEWGAFGAKLSARLSPEAGVA